MILKKQKNISEFTKKYFENLKDVLDNLDINKISKLSKYFEICRNKNAKIFVIGNGGSAVNASAMANDLGFDILKKTQKKPFKIISLTDNNAINTAISNDIGFENLFISQLKTLYQKNDIPIQDFLFSNLKVETCKIIFTIFGSFFGSCWLILVFFCDFWPIY